MAFVRRVRTGSGATAVQIVEYAGRGRQRIVAHVGSAHSEAELGVLMARARELLQDPGQLALDIDPGPHPEQVVDELLAGPAGPALFDQADTGRPARVSGPAQVTGTYSRVLFEALAAVYADLGFDVLGDPVFRDLVIARVVEPTSLLDLDRVLAELGRSSASLSTRKRTLRRACVGGYRDTLAAACFTHAATHGDVTRCCTT